MPEASGGEKVLPASGRKIQRAREEGNVAKSPDLNAAVGLLAALLALWQWGDILMFDMFRAMEYYFSGAPDLPLTQSSMQWMMIEMISFGLRGAIPILLLLLAAGVAMSLIQVGFLYAPKAIAPKFSRVNPITGFARFFSLRSLIELVKSILKLAIALYVADVVIVARWQEMTSYMLLPPLGMISAMSAFAARVWFWVALAMLILALLDYLYQRWQWSQDLRMTTQEAREETREMEGDPRIRQRVRAIQRQMATQRMLRAVPTADVIITNPTTYAIALRYDAKEMAAPVVVAKGARLMANRIRLIAEQNQVPIVERRELARSLYKKVDIGHPVPETLFRAVAEVLAFVYRVDARAEKRRERENQRPEPAF